MDKLVIEGGISLKGEVTVSGAKNAVLPILAATLLTDEPCVIKGVPNLRDTNTMLKILRSLGKNAEFDKGTVTVTQQKIQVLLRIINWFPLCAHLFAF